MSDPAERRPLLLNPDLLEHLPVTRPSLPSSRVARGIRGCAIGGELGSEAIGERLAVELGGVRRDPVLEAVAVGPGLDLVQGGGTQSVVRAERSQYRVAESAGLRRGMLRLRHNARRVARAEDVRRDGNGRLVHGGGS